jgi:hypothetical protein
MVAKSVLKTLTDYFNTGEGKRPMADWAKEIKALSEQEKIALAKGVCEITGDELIGV